MNQSTNSFEDKLRERLHGYESPPPPGAVGSILDQVNGGSGTSPWLITLALLLGIFLIGGGFYRAGVDERSELSGATANQAESALEVPESGRNEQASLLQPIKDVEAIGVSEFTQKASSESSELPTETKLTGAMMTKRRDPAEGTKNSEGRIADSMVETDPASSANKINRTVTSDANQAVIAASLAEGPNDAFDQLRSKDYDLDGLDLLDQNQMTISPYLPREVVLPSKPRHYHFYGDLGVFFLYNHLQPNKDDGLIMENFETSGSLSLDRLSYYAEFGVRRDLSTRVTLRAAAVTNIFAQKYNFDIRDESSSSVVTSGVEDNLFTPVFERQSVAMDHFLISAGARLSADFKVFRNDVNQLMVGLGYHHILNQEHTFEYKGETQRIEYPHQLTASFGFRKVVWQSDRGELSLLPILRYGLIHKASESSALTIKPFSVGLTVGYGLK